MKKYFFIALTLLFFSCNNAKKDTTERSVNKEIVELQVKDASKINNAIKGELNGKLCYPSDYIPRMTIYLKEVESDEVYKLQTEEN